MEPASDFYSLSLPEKETQEFFIQSEQDGLFFGVDFLQHFLKNSNFKDQSVTTYLQDGDCILEGQTCLKVNLKDKTLKKEDLLSIVSYLSGAYTLLSCFTEKNFDFSIMASSTPDFSLSEWEKKAILKSGCLIQKCPENICFYPKDVIQALNKGEKQIILSNLKMSKEEIKTILRDLPSSVTASLHGSFIPSDLEKFSAFKLNSVWPVCLQGFFPLLKMKIVEEVY